MKLVLAHYMLCFTGWTQLPPAPASAWNATCLDEIAVAHTHELDGFALEYGLADYTPQLDAMFAACERFNARVPHPTNPTTRPFRLLPILDVMKIKGSGPNFTRMAEQLLRHANSSCQLRGLGGRPMFSSWDPVDLRGNATARVAAAAEWEAGFYGSELLRGLPRPAFVPFLFAPADPATPNPAAPTLVDQRGILRDFGTALDGLWYWGAAALGDAVAASANATVAACREAGKLSAVPVSAPYSPHRLAPPGSRPFHNGYYPGAGARGIIESWGSHVQSQPDMVVYSTWNDLSEHHYLGPYSHTNWGHSATDWYLDNTSVVPHTAYLELSAYFARWYRDFPAGSPPPAVTAADEAIFYFYNLQLVGNPCPGDPRRATNPTINTTFNGSPSYPVEDALYATVLLGLPANITLTTGLLPFRGPNFAINGNTTGPRPPPHSETFALPAGLHSVQIAALPGGQLVELTREVTPPHGDGMGTAVLLSTRQLGAEGINTTEMSAELCNYQTFSGVLRVQERPSTKPRGR